MLQIFRQIYSFIAIIIYLRQRSVKIKKQSTKLFLGRERYRNIQRIYTNIYNQNISYGGRFYKIISYTTKL